MAAIPTYFRLYLIIWTLQDYKFGVYTNVLRVNEYVGNNYFITVSFDQTLA